MNEENPVISISLKIIIFLSCTSAVWMGRNYFFVIHLRSSVYVQDIIMSPHPQDWSFIFVSSDCHWGFRWMTDIWRKYWLRCKINNVAMEAVNAGWQFCRDVLNFLFPGSKCWVRGGPSPSASGGVSQVRWGPAWAWELSELESLGIKSLKAWKHESLSLNIKWWHLVWTQGLRELEEAEEAVRRQDTFLRTR